VARYLRRSALLRECGVEPQMTQMNADLRSGTRDRQIALQLGSTHCGTPSTGRVSRAVFGLLFSVVECVASVVPAFYRKR
jgi:hypothetical protein